MRVGDLVHSQVVSPLTFSIVPWGNDASSLIAREVRENVAPWLVVVDTQCDNVALVRVGQETKGATRPASAHSEQMVTVNLVPGSTIGVLPDCLLDNTEEYVPVALGLIYIHLDRIAHFL